MRSNDTRPRPNRQMLEEASAWFVDFRIGDIDDAAREEFRCWVQRSPEHIQAYLDIAGTYAELPSPSGTGQVDVAALIAHARSTADDNIVDLSPRAAMPPTPLRGRSPLHASGGDAGSTKRTRIFAVAASILVVTIGGWLYGQRNTFATDVGEQRVLTLPDGSTAQLNSRSTIRVRYGESRREVDLLEGQALFEVAKDIERPFIVRSAGAQIRAVGTLFDVYRKGSATVVTVVEGRVAVDSSPGEGRAPPSGNGEGTGEILLVAGEQVTVTPAAIAQPKPANLAAATAWTQRRLVFENAPLSEVAEEFNRHSTRPMIVDPEALEDFHVSGTYSSSNPESLLRFLRAQPGVRVTETDREIRVAAHKAPGG